MVDVHVISHTHWDREWYLTREQFRLRLVDLIDEVVLRLQRDTRFRYFHLDGQTIVLEDYLEIRPEREPELRQLIADGRLLVGPWYDMPDEFLVSGEALVRNLARGHTVARRFGEPMPVGYLPDLFGHVAQMPQILAQFGLDNAMLWRGFGGPRAEYWWEAPDGTRLLMLHLPPEGYCNAVRVALVRSAMVDRAMQAIERERGRSLVGQVLLMNGVDHVEPHPNLPDLIDRLAAGGVRVAHSTLPAYVRAVRRAVEAAGLNGRLEVIRGELRSGEDYAPLLPGVLSARTYLKQWNAHVQTELERWAEPLSVFAWLQRGFRYPAGELSYAWKTLLQNHPHDSICGCSIDAVHEENVSRFGRAAQVAEALAERAQIAIARPTVGEPRAAAGTSLCAVVFNTALESFAGVVEGYIDLPYASAEPHRHVDPEALDAPVRLYPRRATVGGVVAAGGEPTAWQLLGEEDLVTHVMSRYETPWALHTRRLHVLWLAEVPPCGYATYAVNVSDGGPGVTRTAPVVRVAPGATNEHAAENDWLRLSVNADGTVDILDKRSGRRYPRCGELEDEGDVGDEYNYSPPARDTRITAAGAPAADVTVRHSGPLRVTVHVAFTLHVPAGAAADRRSRSSTPADLPVAYDVTLEAGSAAVTWDVVLDNRARDHRLRMLFPTGAAEVSEIRAETAFGLVRRPARRPVPDGVRVEVPVSAGPMISFVDAGDGRSGATVFARGLHEYEIVDSSVAITLLRAVGHLSRDDLATRPGGHAGPPVATPGAQCLGPHRFRLAMMPRAAEPGARTLYAAAASTLAPPRVRIAEGCRDSLPVRSFFELLDGGGRSDTGGLVLSACKRAEERDSVVLRVFNPNATPIERRLRSSVPLKAAYAVDFLERRQQPLPIEDGAVLLTLGRHRILTIELEPAARGCEKSDL